MSNSHQFVVSSASGDASGLHRGCYLLTYEQSKYYCHIFCSAAKLVGCLRPRVGVFEVFGSCYTIPVRQSPISIMSKRSKPVQFSSVLLARPLKHGLWAAARVQLFAMDGRIMRCGIISWRQSAGRAAIIKQQLYSSNTVLHFRS